MGLGGVGAGPGRGGTGDGSGIGPGCGGTGESSGIGPGCGGTGEGSGTDSNRFPVVEADDRDVVRHPPPGAPQPVPHPPRDLIAAAEDRVGRGGAAQQQAGCLPAPPLAPLPVQNVPGRERHARRVQDAPQPPGPPAGGQEPLGTGDVRDVLPPGLQQMGARRGAAAHVVGQHGRPAGSAAAVGLGHRVHDGVPSPASTGGRGSIRRPVTISPSTRRPASISR